MFWTELYFQIEVIGASILGGIALIYLAVLVIQALVEYFRGEDD
jgi:hypothetical protein